MGTWTASVRVGLGPFSSFQRLESCRAGSCTPRQPKRKVPPALVVDRFVPVSCVPLPEGEKSGMNAGENERRTSWMARSNRSTFFGVSFWTWRIKRANGGTSDGHPTHVWKKDWRGLDAERRASVSLTVCLKGDPVHVSPLIL